MSKTDVSLNSVVTLYNQVANQNSSTYVQSKKLDNLPNTNSMKKIWIKMQFYITIKLGREVLSLFSERRIIGDGTPGDL